MFSKPYVPFHLVFQIYVKNTLDSSRVYFVCDLFSTHPTENVSAHPPKPLRHHPRLGIRWHAESPPPLRGDRPGGRTGPVPKREKAPSSFLLLVAMPFVASSILYPPGFHTSLGCEVSMPK